MTIYHLFLKLAVENWMAIGPYCQQQQDSPRCRDFRDVKIVHKLQCSCHPLNSYWFLSLCATKWETRASPSLYLSVTLWYCVSKQVKVGICRFTADVACKLPISLKLGAVLSRRFSAIAELLVDGTLKTAWYWRTWFRAEAARSGSSAASTPLLTIMHSKMKFPQ